jgi:hypothetical protein
LYKVEKVFDEDQQTTNWYCDALLLVVPGTKNNYLAGGALRDG